MQFKYLFLATTVLLSLSYLSFAQESTLFEHGSSVHTVAFSPVDTSLVVSAGEGGIIKLWNLRDNIVTTFRGHTAAINSVAFSPNGDLLASGGDDWTFRLWDVLGGQHIATLHHITDRTKSQVKAVAFSPDGELLATAGKHVKLWRISDQTEIATLQHDGYVWALAFSRDGKLLAAGDEEGTVKIWDVQKRRAIARLTGDTNSVYSVTFSPDSRILASAGYQGRIKLWNVANQELLGTLKNPGTAFTVDFSIDGKALASTGHKTVSLWSVESGEKIVSLTGHTDWVRAAAFSPDGVTLASGGDDGTVRIQNVETHLQTLQQRDMVRLIYFLPRGRPRRQDIDTKLNILIKDTQQFYAEQMKSYGFEGKTFTFETDATGKAMVHHINGKFTDGHYHNDTLDKVMEEINEQFDRSKHLYLIAIDTSSEIIDIQWCGQGGFEWSGGGRAIIPAAGSCFNLAVTAHELGHAFGLEHDFRNDTYLMSYGWNRHQLSPCAAEWLAASRFFNASQTSFDEPATIQMLSPLAYPPNSINLRFEVTDTDGLHQAQLIIPTATSDPAAGIKLHGCKSLNGEMHLIEFMMTELTAAIGNEVKLRVIDVHGNFTEEMYSIEMDDVAQVDVNGNGIINVHDLVLVAAAFGQSSTPDTILNADVNSDGVVNVNDLLLVVAALETSASAPSAHSQPFTANLERWIDEAKQRDPGGKTFQKGIVVLEQLLAALRPSETVLLANYPNPFNPETWIPYRLAHAAEVQVIIYDTKGAIVRQLDLGHQPAGDYSPRSKAAYWDGHNETGEPVVSGIYLYTLSAGDYSATQKMLLIK